MTMLMNCLRKLCVYVFVLVTFSFSFLGWGNLGVCFLLKCRSTQEVEGKHFLESDTTRHVKKGKPNLKREQQTVQARLLS